MDPLSYRDNMLGSVGKVVRKVHKLSKIFGRGRDRSGSGNLHPLEVDDGTTTEEERNFLTALIRECRDISGPIIEIGTLFGFTTNEMALAKETKRPLVSVDSFVWNPWGLSPQEHKRLVHRVLRVATATLNVSVVSADKDVFYRNYSGDSPCLVFLDAVHTYEETKKDIEWAVKVKAKLIAGHDYSDGFPGVVKAVEEFGVPEVRGSVWVLRQYKTV